MASFRVLEIEVVLVGSAIHDGSRVKMHAEVHKYIGTMKSFYIKQPLILLVIVFSPSPLHCFSLQASERTVKANENKYKDPMRRIKSLFTRIL